MLKVRKNKKSEKGMAMLEIIPIMAIFALIINYGIGFFGVIHSGILNSIAARNYSFETFRNRSNLDYFRDLQGSKPVRYKRVQSRYHGIVNPNGANAWQASARGIKFTDRSPADEVGGQNHLQQTITTIRPDNLVADSVPSEGVDPVWLKIRYGICLTAQCQSTR